MNNVVIKYMTRLFKHVLCYKNGVLHLSYSIFQCKIIINRDAFLKRMAICLETETIETFLQSMDLDKFITLFKENDIDLNLLMNLTETKVMGLLTDIKLTHGNRYKIAHKIEIIKALGKYSVCMAFLKKINKTTKV